MNNQMITTEDLRGMLDEYSPEQQMEIDAQAIREGAKALSDAAAVMKECIDKFPLLIHEMQEASTLHVSDETKTEVVGIGKETGCAIADAFRREADKTVAKAQKGVKLISIPATAAYCLLYFMLLLLVYVIVIITVNYYCWHIHGIWSMTWGFVGGLAFLVSITLLICHKGWV